MKINCYVNKFIDKFMLFFQCFDFFYYCLRLRCKSNEAHTKCISLSPAVLVKCLPFRKFISVFSFFSWDRKKERKTCLNGVTYTCYKSIKCALNIYALTWVECLVFSLEVWNAALIRRHFFFPPRVVFKQLVRENILWINISFILYCAHFVDKAISTQHCSNVKEE